MEAFPKIIHTSDLHLSEDKPETLDALNKILELAEMHKVARAPLSRLDPRFQIN